MPQDNAIRLFERRGVRYSGGEYTDEEFGYRMLRPESIRPGEIYPLILFLHGAGERGVDNEAQIKYLPTWLAEDENRRRYPCFLIAPQCRPDRLWVETPRAFDRDAVRRSPGPQMQVVINILEQTLATEPIDRRRLYLTGLSMGGFGTWDLGTRLAERLGGRGAHLRRRRRTVCRPPGQCSDLGLAWCGRRRRAGGSLAAHDRCHSRRWRAPQIFGAGRRRARQLDASLS